MNEELDALFRDTFPFKDRNELASLEYVSLEDSGIVLRLIIWDDNGDTMSIRDVKEQVVWFPVDQPLDRIRRYLEAMGRVLPDALGYEEVEVLMPHDLFVTNVFKLANDSVEDYVKALSSRSRLGAFMRGTGPSTIPSVDAGKPSAAAVAFFTCDALFGGVERRDEDGRRHYIARDLEIARLSLVGDELVLDFRAPRDRSAVNHHVTSISNEPGWLRFRRPATKDPKPSIAANIEAVIKSLVHNG